MALKAHKESLNRRHQELETAIASEIKKPGFDDLRLVELKRQKLKIKDQIAGLEDGQDQTLN